MARITVSTIGSHSALDITRGAKDEGFATLVVVEKGRDKTYSKYFKSEGDLGCVDEIIEVTKFKDILRDDIQKKMLSKNCIFVPHRSFEVYIDDYHAIENDFKVPIFGNRHLLRLEERTEKPNQYDLLEKAQIKFPKIFKSPSDIDRLVMVKVAEKQRKFERAFFLADSYENYKSTSHELINAGKITQDALQNATIEEFILGTQVNLNFFFSSLTKKLELIGTDTRRQTNLDGILRIPNQIGSRLLKLTDVKYEEAGHIAVTILESMLELAMEIGERFVKASQEMSPPGVIGPFSLQSSVIPGPPKKDIVVFDVSPRMPGSPGIFATPYSGYLHGSNLSMGRRIAIEIKNATQKNQLSKILT